MQHIIPIYRAGCSNIYIYIYIYQTLHHLELAFCKNYFDFTKIFVLSLFIELVNQSCWLEKSFVIKLLVAEKSKPCEIYRRMCDVYGEAR